MPKIVDHQARRQELSAVAAALIAAGGMEAVTIRATASDSGYSKGVVEHYFDNKEELVGAALDWVNQCYEQRVERAIAGLSGLPALAGRIEATLPLNKAQRNEWKVRLVFWSMASIDPGLRRQQQSRFLKARKCFERDISQAIRLGEIDAGADAADRALRLVNMITGISIAALHNLSLYDRTLLMREKDYLLEQLSMAG